MREINPTQSKNFTRKQIINAMQAIKKSCHFYGYTQMANRINSTKNLRKKFSNSLFIIDEVQHMTNENFGERAKTMDEEFEQDDDFIGFKSQRRRQGQVKMLL